MTLMDTLNPSVETSNVCVVIDNHESTWHEDVAPYRLNILTRDAIRRAATWLSPRFEDSPQIRKAYVTLLAAAFNDDTQWVTAEIYDAQDTIVFELIPDVFGADKTIVERLRAVVGRVEASPLFDFLSDVFSLRIVYRHFWKCPASQSHHHAYLGGLAIHSIEMAERVAETPGLNSTDRDIGIVFALLHDIGKLWCYGEIGSTPYETLGHELTGLIKLNDALNILDGKWPDFAVALRSLLSGQWKSKGAKPLLAVAKLVQAYDQSSAEQDLRNRNGHRHQPWNAKPYKNNDQDPDDDL